MADALVPNSQARLKIYRNGAAKTVAVTLAARPEGTDVRVSLEGECQTPTDARELQAALEMLRLFGRAGLESPKTRASMDPVTF